MHFFKNNNNSTFSNVDWFKCILRMQVTWKSVIQFFILSLLISLFAVFIVIAVWWSRIHPWFSHGYKTGKTVYILLTSCLISSICLFSYLIVYALLYFKMDKRRFFGRKKRLCYKRSKKIGNYISIVILSCFQTIQFGQSILLKRLLPLKMNFLIFYKQFIQIQHNYWYIIVDNTIIYLFIFANWYQNRF